jgi:large subunit ribosomal protein L22
MPPSVTDTEKARATSRYVRVAPNKLRQVAALVRGLEVEQARRILQLSAKAAATPMLKTLNSAVANAEHNVGPGAVPYDADELIITTLAVDEGPMLKRFQPRAMGRAYRVRKRTSHITVAVGTPPVAAGRRRRTTPRAAAASTSQSREQ